MSLSDDTLQPRSISAQRSDAADRWATAMAAACAALVDVTGVYRRFVAGGAVRDLGAPVATFHFVPGSSRLDLYPAEILRRETLERTSAHLRIGVGPALAAARARFSLPPTFGGLVDIPWARQRIERAVTISARSSAEAVACLGAWLAAIHTGSEAGAAEVSTDPGGRGETTPPGLRTGSLEVCFTLPLAAI